ncbi:sigma-70 family RNA polymerase sigma factor [Halobacillus sp. MO56]
MDNPMTAGNEFEQQLEKCERMIYKFVHKYPYLDKEELYQEGLITLHEAMESYQESRSNFCSYFYYKINYRFIDIYRKFKRESEKLSNFTYEPISYRPTKEIDSFLLDEIKTHLTPVQEKWFYLYIVRDLSYKEIALLEDTTIDILKNTARGAKKILRPFLREYMKEE